MKRFFAATLATALAVPVPALAQTATRSVSVDYSDLDLTSDAGRKTLDKRIAAAARAVCPAPLRTGTRIVKPDACLSTAMKSVRESLAAKGVSAEVAAR